MKRLAGIVLATIALCLSLVPAAAASPAATADETVGLELPAAGLTRGAEVYLALWNVRVGVHYVATVDHGAFVQDGSTTVDFTGSYSSMAYGYLLPASDPVTEIRLSLSVAGDPTVLASAVIPVNPPSLRLINRLCPGQRATIAGKGFVDGSYQVQAAHDAAGPVVVQTVSGAFIAQLTLAPNPGASIEVSSTADGSTDPAATGEFALSEPSLTRLLEATDTPWSQTFSAECFEPDEQVLLRTTGGVEAPATVTADAGGNLSFSLTYRQAEEPPAPASLTMQGQTSSRTLQQELVVPSAILLPPNDMSGGYVLATAAPGYSLGLQQCGGLIQHWLPGGPKLVWSALPTESAYYYAQDCPLTMRADGDAHPVRPGHPASPDPVVHRYPRPRQPAGTGCGRELANPQPCPGSPCGTA